MKQPLRRPVNRQARAIEKTFPPPVGGWVANKSIASMKPTEAVELINFFPRTTHVETRMGSQQHMILERESIKTMVVWKGPTGTEKMLCTTSTGVFDASFGGTSGEPSRAIIATRTNGKHQSDQFGDGTNNWLIMVNGVDKPVYYNGVSTVLVDAVSSPAITGITSTDIVGLGVFKNRLLFIRNNKLGFDYLPAAAAGGATSYFDLSSVAARGGYLMAIGVWSRDAGLGPDDYAVFITSQGEALIYAGTDPSSATTWSLIGTYKIGKPLGRKCILKYGTDPLVLTESGVFPLSALLTAGDERERFAVSYNIQNAFSDASANTISTYGWRMVSYPEQDMLIVNVPKREDGPHEQFVMNTITKAWCKFTGWDAEDFCVFNRTLYYCKGDTIYEAWTRVTDEYKKLMGGGTSFPVGKAITHTARSSFQDWGSEDIKQPLMFMPIIESPRNAPYSVGIDTDFRVTEFLDPPTEDDNGVARWGSGLWGVSRWGGSDTITRRWQGAGTWPGRWLSGKIRLKSVPLSTVYESAYGTEVPALAKWVGSVIRYTIGKST